uniref:Uncharacterized protein n=1 Tax=Erpetoichthys calabaricus TaxID=27687 RepID=A0A8C4T6L8_ERPCA
MAESRLLAFEDELICSLCLDTLTDLVSLHCGHSFCLKCLTDCWDHSQVYCCPQCKRTFTTRPELHVKTGLSEVVKKLKKVELCPPPPPAQNYVGPGDVECDACIEKKFRAVKSCLTCMASFCQTHLQPHVEEDAWKGHKLSFADLIHCMKETRRKVIERIREQEKKEVEKAQGVLKQLEKDMEELKRRDAELKKFAEIKDNVQFLKVRSSVLCSAPSPISSLFFFSLFSDFCPLTLDINTAHRLLRLSEGNKKVTCKKTKTKHPDHPDRFQCWAQVLCRETLAGTRCYWEVDWSGDITAIGVAYKGISRKGEECRLGHNDKSWSLWWSYLKCFVCHNDEQSVISAPYSPRVGVYLDWPAGSLSFYNVSHTMTLLHRFDTSFTEPLCPGFYLGPDSSVTICNLTPGDH